MKKSILFALCFLMSLSFIGCSSTPPIETSSTERIPITSSNNSDSTSDAETSETFSETSTAVIDVSKANSSRATVSNSSESTVNVSSLSANLTESSKFKIPPILSNNCVLQQKSKVKIWGEFSEDGPLKLVFANKEYKANCHNGKFEFTINTPAASLTAYDIVIHNGKEKKTIRNVAVGEVFLCGGQSNMVFFNSELKTTPPEAKDGGNKFIRHTNTYPINKRVTTPMPNVQGIWYVADNGTFPGTSAFVSNFTRAMFAQLNVPIGVVTCAMSDSSLAAWLTEKDAESLIAENVSSSSPYYQHTPGQLYNAILSSFLDYTFKAVVWYQGESSTHLTYEQNLKTFITCWRKYLNNNSLPFVIIQLPGYGGATQWPEAREGQKKAALSLSNCAYSVNIDLGDEFDIHPQDKKPVALRAANVMLNLAYGKNTPTHSEFKQATKSGSTVTIEFKNADGLYLKNNLGVGFEFSSDGKTWTDVPSDSVSVSQNKIKITGLASATHIRYAWKNWPQVSVFNRNDLPAEPFNVKL